MAEKQVLLALADRCEREGPSRELDAEIAVACRIVPDFDPSIYTVVLGYRAVGDRVEVGRIIRKDEWWYEAIRSPAAFTTSLDAAVTLVPEGWRLRNMDQGDPASKYLPPAAELIPLSSNDDGWAVIERVKGGCLRSTGRTLTMAICAVSLRARAALSEKG